MSEKGEIQRLIENQQRLEERLHYLEDRMAVRDVSIRLARGDDRLDKDIRFEAYADDAIDDHLGFCGSREEFFEWIWDSHRRSMESSPSKPDSFQRPSASLVKISRQGPSFLVIAQTRPSGSRRRAWEMAIELGILVCGV